MKLLTTFVEKSGEPEAGPSYVAQQVSERAITSHMGRPASLLSMSRLTGLRALCLQIMPPLLDPILLDYKQSLPAARDAEVLRLFEVAIDKLGVREREREAVS